MCGSGSLQACSGRKVARTDTRMEDAGETSCGVLTNICCTFQVIRNNEHCNIPNVRGWSGVRAPAGVRFSLAVQTDYEAHPASCTTGTGSFSGGKRSGRGVTHPPPSSAEIKERVKFTFTPPPAPSLPVIGRTVLLLCRCARRCVVVVVMMM